ncbi:MAG TPA: N-acetyl-gamma-glutamyl-phosphate reductase [Candidatus Anammoximicrobium sp.]|nr:N-acetyl-gamma-glutamyl-phosphate reductase [Candidatus Anammoximicrobium sp.]
MIRIGILGATGYTALELIKLLLRHPETKITALTSRQQGEPHVAAIHPSLAGRLDLRLRDLNPEQVAAECDCVFSCLPHGASAQAVKPLVDAGVRVVDFSADYRLNDLAVYRAWYEDTHCDAQRLGKVPYGLPELFADQIAGAMLVANPGCYPTSAILPMAPLLENGLVEPAGIIFDSKSGVSGAGRTPKLTTHFPECNESFSAYNVGKHRHNPEIDQVLGTIAGQPIETIFTPHLVPMTRGILTTAYAIPARPVTEAELMDALRAAYAGQVFVQVVDHLPATKDVSNTNFCQLTARLVRGRVIVICCIDNLVKGASGAAVQNFNWMYGFPESTALL